MDDQHRLRQHPTEIVPHERVEGLSQRIGGSTTLWQGGPIRLASPAAHGVALVAWKSPPCTRQATLSAADQAPQEVWMRGIMTPCHRLMPLKPRVGHLNVGLADNCRHGYRDPLLRRGSSPTDPAPHGMQRRPALGGRDSARLTTLGHSRVVGCPEDMADGSRGPPRLSSR
jgi:hypothetical protein